MRGPCLNQVKGKVRSGRSMLEQHMSRLYTLNSGIQSAQYSPKFQVRRLGKDVGLARTIGHPPGQERESTLSEGFSRSSASSAEMR